jgi:glycosyltransferase involved in cell wall biosynthesis
MFEDKVTVSVVIPAYNQARFLKEAIESALSQTYPISEIVVVDDGSTDETPEVAQGYGNLIHYIRQENQGLAAARNTGILHSNGKYIALLDSDDQWLPPFLQTMTSLISQNSDATVFYCGWRYVDVDSRTLPQQPQTKVVPPDEIYWALLRANFLIPSSVVLERSQILKAGLFDPAFRRLQDWELWLRLLKAGHIFVGSNACLVHYRLHGNALSDDPHSGQQAVMALVEKLFGTDDGDRDTWSLEKRRAYGGAYRYHLLTSINYQNDWRAGKNFLCQAIQIDPTLVDDLDLFYELALSSQPVGYRGSNEKIALENNAELITNMLKEMFNLPSASTLASLYRQVFGTAYYALGLVAYNTGNYYFSRRFLSKALYYRPDLWHDNRIMSNLIKSFLSSTMLNRLREYRRLIRA